MNVHSDNASRGGLLALGILLIIIGLIAIGVPFIATLAIELLLGWILLISGIVVGIHAFSPSRRESSALTLLRAILYCVAGILMLVYPLGGALTLTLLLAILFTLQGLFKIIAAMQLRPMPNWGWLLFSGILSLIIGGLIWANWPSSAVWAIGLLVGINIFLGGWTLVMFSAASPR